MMSTMIEQTWEAFHVPLYQFIRRRVTDEATAEDLLQDVFLKIHQHSSSLKDARRLESWIYQIARNLGWRAISKSLDGPAYEGGPAAAKAAAAAAPICPRCRQYELAANGSCLCD